MKTELKKSILGKGVSFAIVAVVLVGALFLSGVAEIPAQSGIMAKAFVFFISAVIVVQVVPAVMLLGAMLKGVFNMAGKMVQAPVKK